MIHTIELFSFIPLINIENKKNDTKIKLLGIPVIKIKKRNEKKTFFLLGFLPIFRIINKSSCLIKKRTEDYEIVIDKIKSKIAQKKKIVVIFFINEVSKLKTITL